VGRRLRFFLVERVTALEAQRDLIGLAERP
jgi:hypothetical protein